MQSVVDTGDEAAPTKADAILELTIRAIDEGGEASVRVLNIAKAAGTSVASLYRAFGSREGLVEAALARRFEAGWVVARDAFSELCASAPSRQEFAAEFEDLLRKVFSPSLTPIRQRRMNVAGGAFARPGLRSLINDAQRRWVDDLVTALEVARERGFIEPKVDLRTLVGWHIVTSNGIVSIEGDPTGVDFEAWLDLYVETMTDLLGIR